MALVPKPANKSTKRIPTTTLYPKPTAGSHKRIHPIVKSSAYSVREVAAFCRRLHGPASCRKEQLSIWHTRHECPQPSSACIMLKLGLKPGNDVFLYGRFLHAAFPTATNNPARHTQPSGIQRFAVWVVLVDQTAHTAMQNGCRRLAIRAESHPRTNRPYYQYYSIHHPLPPCRHADKLWLTN